MKTQIQKEDWNKLVEIKDKCLNENLILTGPLSFPFKDQD
jgi:hypothetical protein